MRKIQEKNRLCTFSFTALLEVKFFYGLVVIQCYWSWLMGDRGH